MDWLQIIKDFFNNQSVGAFVGAFAAYILVLLTDRRRDSKRVRDLIAEILMCQGHAEAKLESVRRNRLLLREHNQVAAAPILKFNTSLIRQLTGEVLSRLSLDQRKAIDALCYTMEAIDEILDDAFRIAKESTGTRESGDRRAIADRLNAEYGDAIANLKRLAEMCGEFVKGRSDVLLSKQYDLLDYQE